MRRIDPKLREARTGCGYRDELALPVSGQGGAQHAARGGGRRLPGR